MSRNPGRASGQRACEEGRSLDYLGLVLLVYLDDRLVRELLDYLPDGVGGPEELLRPQLPPLYDLLLHGLRGRGATVVLGQLGHDFPVLGELLVDPCERLLFQLVGGLAVVEPTLECDAVEPLPAEGELLLLEDLLDLLECAGPESFEFEELDELVDPLGQSSYLRLLRSVSQYASPPSYGRPQKGD